MLDDSVYKKNCDNKFDSGEKILIFSCRILVETLAIISSLFILITIYKSKKKSFWPFKVIFCQVTSELIDLIGAIAFTVNSSCQPKACSIVGYIMHCNWLASLSFSFFLSFNYFCIIKMDFLFHYLIKHLKKILLIIYLIPYCSYYWLYYGDGFGPTGWILKDGEFFFIFCGCNICIIYLKFLTNRLSTTGLSQSLCCSPQIQQQTVSPKIFQKFCHLTRSYPFQQKEQSLLFGCRSAISSVGLLTFVSGMLYFTPLRIFYKPSTPDIQEPHEMSWWFYPIYLIANLGFELHLTVGAVLFYFVYTGFLNIDEIWRGILKQRKKSTYSLDEFNESFNEIVYQA